MATLSRLPFLTSRCGPRPSTIPAGYNHPTFRSSLGIGSRNVSLAYEKTAAFKPTRRLIRNIVLGTSIILALGAGCIYATDTRASAHRWIIPPMMRLLYPDAEDAHHAGVEWLKFLYRFGLHPRERGDPDGTGELVTQVYGYTLSNPIGISAGLDKDAEIPSALFALGPAVVEVGGTTPFSQVGNPKPRVFRLLSQNALINRYGLNSKGADRMALLLRRRVGEFAYANGFGLGEFAEQRVLDGEAGVPPGSLTEGKLLAVQIAKSKSTPDKDIEAIKKDYVYCVDRLAKYADILVVNVSSPNTPGLRDLQQTGPLKAILKGVVDAANRTDRKTKPLVMVKVSPDEDTDEQIAGICDAVWASGVGGVIVANSTTRHRLNSLPKGYVLPPQEQVALKETGGFSGPHLFEHTIALVSRYRALLDQGPLSVDSGNATIVPSTDTSNSPPSRHQSYTPKVIFASGGITNGQQAFQILKAGANVAMMYTGLVYGGSGTITRVKQELREEKRNKIR